MSRVSVTWQRLQTYVQILTVARLSSFQHEDLIFAAPVNHQDAADPYVYVAQRWEPVPKVLC